MRKATRWLLASLVLLSCSVPSGAPRPRDRTLLTGEQILATHASTLFDAIQQLRPEFLRSRGASSIESRGADIPRVFVDNIEMGDVQFLKLVNPQEVAEVQRISAEEATTRWGTGYVGGALVVTTHSGAARRGD